jgi:hypothetical protein
LDDDENNIESNDSISPGIGNFGMMNDNIESSESDIIDQLLN